MPRQFIKFPQHLGVRFGGIGLLLLSAAREYLQSVAPELRKLEMRSDLPPPPRVIELQTATIPREHPEQATG